MTAYYTQITLFMAMSTATKTSAKSDLNIAKAIATLQTQVKANSEAIRQALPRDQVQVSNNTVLSLVFVILVAMIGWVKIDQNGLRQELSNKIDIVETKLSQRIDQLDEKIDANHKQIINILLKRK